MNRWIVQAVVFGVAISEAAGSLLNLPRHLLLSSGADSSGSDDSAFDPVLVVYEYLNECSQASLNFDSCLVSNTLAALGSDDDDDDDDDAFFSRRFLEEEDCGAPDIDEQHLRAVMVDAEAQCSEEDLTDQDFDSTVSGFITLLGSEQCFKQMCDNFSNPSVWLEMAFDEAAKCAQVEPDMPRCLKDEVLEMILENDYSETDSVRRKLRRTLSQDESACEQNSEWELYLEFLVMLSEAESKCIDADVYVSQEQLQKATSDLVAMFANPHCWGVEGCGNIDMPVESHNDGGMDFSIAIEYVGQCAQLDLPEDSCLWEKTIDTFAALGASSGGDEVASGEDECIPPEFDELTMHYIVEESKKQCTDVSDESVNATVDGFMNIWGAQDCWVAICEESSDPSDMLIDLMLDKIGQCAGSDLDFNPCLRDQIVALIAPDGEDENGAFDGFRRKLEHTFGSESGDDPCASQRNDTKILVMLADAKEQCLQLGHEVSEEDAAKAEQELFKLFTAEHCWGVPSDCGDDKFGEPHNGTMTNGTHHSEYLESILGSTTWLLGQCANAEEISCVFSRSVEVMHGMKYLGWSNAGHADPHHIIQEAASSMCTPPNLDEYDIEKIATHAKDYCLAAGFAVDGVIEQTITDLQNLVAEPSCWEGLCTLETKDAVVKDWMYTCAGIDDLSFLTSIPSDEYSGPTSSAEGHDDNDDDAFLHDDALGSGDSSLWGDDVYDLGDDYFGYGGSPENDMLMCMTNFMVPQMGQPNANWACILPHVNVDDVCDVDMGREAYLACGGEVVPPPPSPSPSPSSPSPSMHLSMSFAYDESDYDWAQYDPSQMSLSYAYGEPLEDGFSMSYDDSSDSQGDVQADETEMLLLVGEVCSLISGLNSEVAHHCLGPVCEDLWIADALELPDEGTLATPTAGPVPSPTPPPTSKAPSDVPTTSGPTTSGPTTMMPTPNPTAEIASSSVPTKKPTPFPTPSPSRKTLSPTSPKPPTPSPTVAKFGEVQVSVTATMTLEGIDVSSIADKVVAGEFDKIVDFLESVLAAMIPEDAMLRLLSVGGFSVTRRLLRLLQDSAGVDVEFEITMTQTCSQAKCAASEAQELSSKISSASDDLKAKVESGEVTNEIQKEAEASGVKEFATVSASKIATSEPKVTVRSAQTGPDDDDDDDDSGSPYLGTVFSFVAAVLVSGGLILNDG